MKPKFVLAAIAAAFTALLAAPASAYDYDYGRGGYDRYRGGGEIHVVTQRGQLSVDRDDYLFDMLVSRPYRFRPGFTYVYTDRCNRQGCLVVELGRGRVPVDRFFAPYIPRGIEFYGRGGSWDADNRAYRGSDRDWHDGRGWRQSGERDWRGQGDDDDYRDGHRDGYNGDYRRNH